MLKSLELFGFKSFADRTKFEFGSGITGVVGPNGSGKSNIVDAIKWILGDQSPKSLRGKEMTDVIFNGAAGRKPSQLAEALMTFDNSSGFLAIESQEVQVGRRIWRSGDSEYLINRTTVRLKDIRDLFVGTGAGPSAYCIIEQGRVDQILQANATSRRAIFEEAAGIGRFKARKSEAMRKLERVDQNLLRLTDIVDEVEAQLNSMRTQAEKAAKSRALSEELREAWLGLSADDYRDHSAQLEQVEQAVGNLESETSASHNRHQELERRLSALDVEIAEVEDRLREAERSSATNREGIVGHEATIQHQAARNIELDAELIRLRKQRTGMVARTQGILGELQHTKDQRDRFEADFTKRKTDLESRQIQNHELAAKIDGDRKRVEADRQRLLDLMRSVSASGNRVSGLQSQLQALHVTKQSSEGRRDKLHEQIAACRAECDRRQIRVHEAEQRISVDDEKIRGITNERKSLHGEQNQFQQRLAEKREQRSAWQARKSVLEDLESRQEGLGIGVQEILRRAQTSDYPPWNRIRGSVADLIDVDLEQAALLEVAMGSRSQLIVLDELDSLIAYLGGGACQISGRVGFVVYGADPTSPQAATRRTKPSDVPPSKNQSHNFDHFRIDPATLPDLSGCAGIQNRADRLVMCEELPLLAEQLLADTWIVDTLDTALELSKDAGRGCRFVTLQGELLDADGTLFVGTIRSETAVLSRKSELRRLKSELIRLDRQIVKEQSQLSNLTDSLGHTDRELEAAQSNLQISSDQHAELKSELAGLEQELDRLRRDRDTLDNETARITIQQDQFEGELHNSQMQLARVEEDLQALESGIDQSERDVARAKHRLQTLKQRSTAEQLDLAKQEERLIGLRLAYERLEQDQQLRVQQRDEAERRFEMAASKRQQIALHILNANAFLAELFLTEEQSVEHVAALIDQKEQLRSQRAKLGKEEAALLQQQRTLNERQHCEELKARDIRHQLSSLEERIEEEYQLVLADVVETGASALRPYQQELRRRLKADAADEVSVVEVEGESKLAARTRSDGEPEESDLPNYEEVRDHLEANVNRLRRKLKLMGSVDPESLRDLDDLEKRYGYLSSQLEDLLEAKHALEDIVRRINSESKRLFSETFEQVRSHFRDLFRKAFGGGDGEIVLEDWDDVLECGIDIVARPPGKELTSISLMSGGEKTLTAFALLLALFKTRPSPYCILDEVDAALDEANVDRLLALLKEFNQTVQFITITHKKPTMAIADVLYGVTMEQPGVSKRMSVRFEDVREDGEFSVSNQPTFTSTQDGQMKDAA
jgi:chromosome segregation protein